MATRLTCDRCGKAIDQMASQDGAPWYSVQPSDDPTRHLCSSACLLGECMVIAQQQKQIATERAEQLQAAAAAAEEQQRLAQQALDETVPRPIAT